MTAASTITQIRQGSQKRIRCKMCKQVLVTPEYLTGHGVQEMPKEAPRKMQIEKFQDTSVIDADPAAKEGGQNPMAEETVKVSTDHHVADVPSTNDGVDAALHPSESAPASAVLRQIISNPNPSLLLSLQHPPLTRSVAPQARSPSLVRAQCSGYFVEPMKWMSPILSSGEQSGRIVCPNERCKAKLGNYDWSGVCCGCKEWVVPGFCIHRSKVDEIG